MSNNIQHDINSLLRGLFRHLIEREGFKKLPICRVTLGRQSMPLFERFVKDGFDLGFKPLKRLLNGLGYEMYILPVRNDDQDTKQYVAKVHDAFINTIDADLKEFLKNQESESKAPVTEIFQKAIEELKDDIE